MDSKDKNDKDNIKSIKSAELGDMIEFVRGPHYSHWAIFVGDDFVIHRWGENDGVGQSVGVSGGFLTVSGVRFDKATILQSKIDDVLQYGGYVRINNYLDKKFKPLPVQFILDKARRSLNEEGYNLVFSNCEHFATECRYGEPNSRQVQVAVGGALTGIAFLGLAFSAFALISKFSEKNNDVEKKEKERNIST